MRMGPVETVPAARIRAAIRLLIVATAHRVLAEGAVASCRPATRRFADDASGSATGNPAAALKLVACLERNSDRSRAPASGLSCELIPPRRLPSRDLENDSQP